MKTLLGFIVALSCIPSAFSQDAPLPKPENFHLFLLAGQSNMAGRGEVSKEDRKTHPRVLTLNRDGAWVPARDPIHFDKRGAGVGPGRAFGIALAEANPDITVGLIPCATGGSPISVWEPGKIWSQTNTYPYDDAIRRTLRATKNGTLKAILWHQGEGDANEELADNYEAALRNLLKRFRVDLDNPHLPIFIGQLGQFAKRPWTDSYRIVDHAHQDVAAEDTHVLFVSSNGLTSESDNIHFNAPSMRTLGQRYAQAYRTWYETTEGNR